MRAEKFVHTLGWFGVVHSIIVLLLSLFQASRGLIAPSNPRVIQVTTPLPYLLLAVFSFTLIASWFFIQHRYWSLIAFKVIIAIGSLWWCVVIVIIAINTGKMPGGTVVISIIQFGTTIGLLVLCVYLLKRLNQDEVKNLFVTEKKS